MKKKYQPIIEDGNGALRKQLNSLHKQTHLAKRLLIAKALQLGLAQLGSRPELQITIGNPSTEQNQ